MAAVEHPQLHLFPRQHIIGHLGAGDFPRRAARHEVILNDPLNKWLTADGARVFYAERGADFSQRFIGSGRHDTVNHGAGKTDVFSNPLRQFGGALFRHAQNRIFHHVTVIRNIIAGEYRKRRQAAFAAARQGFNQYPRHRLRQRGMLQIVNNARLRQVQRAAGGIDAVAFLRNGE